MQTCRALIFSPLVALAIGCVPGAPSEPSSGGGKASGGQGGGANGNATGGSSAPAPAASGGAGPSAGGGSSGGGTGGGAPPLQGAGGGGGSAANPGTGGSKPADGAVPGGDGQAGETAPTVDIGPTPPAPPKWRDRGIVVYWGQNGYSRATTDVNLYEKDLYTTCKENPHYEAVVVGFVIDFKSPENKDGTPRLNFSKHCNSKMAYDADHPRLYRCDDIARGINECQRGGKKVLISMGGANGPYRFNNDAEATTFAQTTFDLFLGGKHTHRPFTTAVMDGVDLDIEGGGPGGYAAYVRKLRELMNADKSRTYYITGAPQCPFPDAQMGPAPGRVLGEAAGAFDFLFVQFYNNFCGGFNPDLLASTFNQWAGVGPKILVGLPAREGAGGGFVARGALPGVLNRVKNNPKFGGVMLWDASYDQNNVEGGTKYSQFVKTQM